MAAMVVSPHEGAGRIAWPWPGGSDLESVPPAQGFDSRDTRVQVAPPFLVT